jgi:HEPN domain-containing protein
MTRADWQQIAEERLFATQALLAAHNWPSAYYLAGYAVECGLKSCILARVAIVPEIIFLEKRFSEKCWTHEIEELMKLAALEAIRDADFAANLVLGANWEIAKKWSEKSRYQMKTQTEAEELYNAIADTANRVMQWIRARW